MKIMLRAGLYRFARDRKANVAVIFALVMVPTVFLLGMALDYTHTQHMKVNLDSAADAAAVATITSAMMQQSPQAAQTAAKNVFNITANGLVSNNNLPAQPTLTVAVNCSRPDATTGYCTYPACPGTNSVYSDPKNSNNQIVRNVQVCYNAAANNSFPSLLRQASWPFAGQSSARNQSAPNINFYLLLDDSPSMGIGATPNDISNLIAATKNQSVANSANCGFACHEAYPCADRGANPAPTSSQNQGATSSNCRTLDNLAVARNNNITLRIDLVTQAVQSLMNTAYSISNANRNTYGVAIYTFDTALNNSPTTGGSAPIFAPSGKPGVVQTPLTPSTTTSYTVAQMQNAASSIQLMAVGHAGCQSTSSSAKTEASSSPCISGDRDDTDTNIEGALTSLNSLMPVPGNGTNSPSDTPQEVVFLVTDGVDDSTGISSCSQPTVTTGGGYTRCQQPIDTTICTTIKNKNIRIAVLYTEYVPLSTNSWYNTHIAPFNAQAPSTSQIAANLKSCASPGLFTDVQNGGNISDALQKLFLQVASDPRLTQ
ncbi:TadE/TadG family type IV pilus assembly protein [Bradyrhizobium sp. LLZ17]|uniref:TadE/TadG family type IV pilus assembly protein n=1 Tax=Bradyrhizobium sp. LLZ17 TaxID=3239388 RepID=A0AB39XNZ4_9BRAD